jgi:hypothetical protein
MYDDYAELRQQLSRVDLNDPKSLRKWFDSHHHLTVNDHAIIMGKCTKTVRKLRKKAGICGLKPKTNIKPIPRKSPIIILPSHWRTAEWLTDNIKRYGSDAVIKATGFTKKAFYEILRKLKVPYSGTFSSKNPLCNKAWCYRHYVELNYNLAECARIAGVNRNTISNWLVKFKIPLRNRKPKYKRSCNRVIPLLFRSLFNQLDEQPIVKKIRMYNRRLTIQYHDGGERHYNLSSISPDQFHCKNPPKSYHEYGYDIDGSPIYPAHLAISRASIKNSSVFEVDVALHNYNQALGERGWIPPIHPTSAVMAEWDYVKSLGVSDFTTKNGYKSYTNKSVGVIYQSFFDLSYLNATLHNAYNRWKVISYMRSSSTPFNYDYLIRQMFRHKIGVKLRLINPAFYSALYKLMGVKRSVLDLSVMSGARALGACIAGIDYYVIDDTKLEYSIKNGIDTLGFKHRVHSGERVDLVIADNDLSELGLEDIDGYFKIARQVMAYVDQDNVEEYKRKYRPRDIFSFTVYENSKDNHYYFIW